jgi:TRAP-type C4-dicarboxylate transport system substrate-binding protein
MTLTRRAFLPTFTAALTAPWIVGRAHAATPLVVASLLGEDKPETLIWEFIRDRVEEEMPGAFTFNIVPNAALGGEKEVAEGVRLGSIQASLSTLSNLAAWVPESQLFDMPFLFRDAAHLRCSLEGPYGSRLRERLADQGMVAPAFINYGARHLLSREPLAGPQDLDGRRIRIIASPLHARLWEGFGTLPVALPITETYNALSTGHVDAMDLTKSAYAGFRLYEVVPHVIETGHIHAAGAVIFSAGFWSRLDDAQRATLERAAVAGARHFDALMVADENASVETAKAGGATFHAIADRAGWEGPARAVWESFADRVGGMDAIRSIAEAEACS